MKKKSIEIQKQVKIALERQKEIEQLLIEAEKEEAELIERLEAEINKISDENELFCGVILDHQNLLSVIDLALRSKEAIKIPFKLYYKE